MTTRYGFKYKDYLLECDPMPMADGRYGSQVTVRGADGSEAIERRFPALDYFSTELEAVEHAKYWGKSWVDDHG